MPQLSGEQRAQVVALRESGLSWSRICDELYIPRSTARGVAERLQRNASFQRRPELASKATGQFMYGAALPKDTSPTVKLQDRETNGH